MAETQVTASTEGAGVGDGPGGRAIAAASDVAERIRANVERVVRGKREEILLVLTALACDGHVLFDDVPGTAKTVLARALAQSVAGASVSRIQCTPDLQPADVTGLSVYDQRAREFEFRPGPIFANVVLVDEINRATPKTQSALLEAMAERQVTVDGATRALPTPFLLLATENPIEHEGTFLLPEAQLDRFLIRIRLGYPEREDELRVVADQVHGHPLAALRPAVDLDEVRALQTAVEHVFVHPLIRGWIVDLVRATRALEGAELGASVRGSLALDRAARGRALVLGRPYVVPEDVEALFAPVVGHRLVLGADLLLEYGGRSTDEVVAAVWERCLEAAPRPAPRLA